MKFWYRLKREEATGGCGPIPSENLKSVDKMTFPTDNLIKVYAFLLGKIEVSFLKVFQDTVVFKMH